VELGRGPVVLVIHLQLAQAKEIPVVVQVIALLSMVLVAAVVLAHQVLQELQVVVVTEEMEPLRL